MQLSLTHKKSRFNVDKSAVLPLTHAHTLDYDIV